MIAATQNLKDDPVKTFLLTDVMEAIARKKRIDLAHIEEIEDPSSGEMHHSFSNRIDRLVATYL